MFAGTDVPDAGLEALGEIAAAVRAGAGLPEVVRAAARALGASLALIDRTSSVLAVAARSPADERELMAGAANVEVIELRVADAAVGQLRMRAQPGAEEPDATALSLVTTLIAAEVERVRAPERASAAAAADFVHAALRGEPADPDDLVARGRELGIDLRHGASVVVARAHPRTVAGENWRARLLSVSERTARAAAPSAIAAAAAGGDGGEVLLLVPDADGEAGRRVAAAVLRELEVSLPGFAFAVGRSRPVTEPGSLPRAGDEALLAANVVESDPERAQLGYEETGSYRLLLPYMGDDRAELERFYAETVQPLVAYDEQYATDLVGTLEAFLECDGNVGATAAKLVTHRHTVRYRFERVRELSGLDIGSSDGRERLSLGLKAMRVLGIGRPGGPVTESGAGGGRVPRRRPDRGA